MALIDSNKANLTNVSFLSETEKSFPRQPHNEPIAHGRKPLAPSEENRGRRAGAMQPKTLTFVSLIPFLFPPSTPWSSPGDRAREGSSP